MRKISKAVIPCAGYGTRLLPITKLVPKELLPIGTKPAIQYIVEEAIASGIEEIILVCARGKFSIAEYFQPNAALETWLAAQEQHKELEQLRAVPIPQRLRVVYQEHPRGLGDAIRCAESAVQNERFAVLLPDVIGFDTAPLMRELIAACARDDQWGITLKTVPPREITTCGIVRGRTTSDGHYAIEGAIEKPSVQAAPSNLAILGRYVLPPTIFPLLAELSTRVAGELQITDAIDLLAQRQPGIGVIATGEIYDIGNTEGLAAAWKKALAF